MRTTGAPLGATRSLPPTRSSPTPSRPTLRRASTGIRSRSATPALRQRLERAGWATATVDLAEAADKSAILDAIGRGLVFPAWVGHNWDALDDALRDLSWWPAGTRGRLIVIRGAGRGGSPRDRETLHDVLATATARWAASGTPLVVLLRR